MKGLLDFLLNYFSQSLWAWIKFESIKLYASVSETLRAMFVHLAATIFLYLMALSGFIFIHMALFFIIPWSTETKAIILLCLGSLYFLVPIVFILILSSRRCWSKVSGLEDFARRASSSRKHK